MSLISDRRQFLRRAAVLSSASLPFSTANAAFEPIKRVGGSHLKTSLNVYSFLELLNANLKDKNKGVDLFGVCDFCAKCGFDAVDVTGYFFPGYPEVPEDRFIIALKRHAFNLGLGISGTGVRNDFTTADKIVRAEGVQRIKNWIEVAAKLGAPTIRAFADSQPPFKNWKEASGNATREQVEEWMAADLLECAKHGEKFGVIVAVQNHGDFINTGTEHLSLLKRVDHEWCSALVDTGKYITEDPYLDIAMLAPYAVNWQIKETLFSEPDAPRTDMKKLLALIRKSGYRGYLPIETLSMRRPGYDSYVEVAKMLKELQQAITDSALIAPEH